MLYYVFNPTVYFPLWWFFWIVWMFFRRSDEWLLKDDSDNILYSTTYDSKTDSAVKHLYRAAPEFRDRIASIQYISDSVWLIKRDSEETGWFFQTPCFEYADSKYCWSGRSKLTNTAGTTILRFKTSSWGYTKVGDLTTVEMDEGMREVVLATMVAMDWSVGISVAKEKRRAEECQRACEEDHQRECEERNRKNSLQVQAR